MVLGLQWSAWWWLQQREIALSKEKSHLDDDACVLASKWNTGYAVVLTKWSIIVLMYSLWDYSIVPSLRARSSFFKCYLYGVGLVSFAIILTSGFRLIASCFWRVPCNWTVFGLLWLFHRGIWWIDWYLASIVWFAPFQTKLPQMSKYQLYLSWICCIQ